MAADTNAAETALALTHAVRAEMKDLRDPRPDSSSAD